MLKFYRLAAGSLLAMITATILLICGGIYLSQTKSPLLPHNSSFVPWVGGVEPKSSQGGTSLQVMREDELIEYNFLLSSDQRIPFTSYAFNFTQPEKLADLIDLTEYDTVSFKMSCSPTNVLLFALYTYDKKSTVISDTSSYRVSSTFFTCDDSMRDISISLDRLDTPDWWLDKNGYQLSDRGYRLDQVLSFAFVNSLQSPRAINANVKVFDVILEGESPVYLYIAIVVSVFAWLLLCFWLLRLYVSELVEQVKVRIKQNRPFIAYQKISTSSKKDEVIGDLLKFIATEYSNPDVSIESAVSALSLSRSKINDVLKSELGLSFSGYVTKLRLTESARLLSEQEDMNIAQIAYAVGFKNVTYFNKLFKGEYGCTPKTFKKYE